jgi:hypothetical protein
MRISQNLFVCKKEGGEDSEVKKKTYATCEHDVKQNAEGPKVDSVRVGKAQAHFGRGVGHGAQLLARHVVRSIGGGGVTIGLVHLDAHARRRDGDGAGRHRFCAVMPGTSSEVRRRPRAASGKNLGHAEVCEDDVAVVREEDVGRFDVPVYYATRVQGFQSTNQLGHVKAREGDGYVATAKVEVITQIRLV